MSVLSILLAVVSLVLAAIVLSLVYLFLQTVKNKNYWPKKGVTYAGYDIIGNPINNIVWPQSVLDIDLKLLAYCKKFNVKFIGGSEFFTPFFFCRDLDIIKRVLVKDFDYFLNRRHLAFEDTDPFFCKMLFNLEGSNWKNLRAKMTGTFTTGKIKRMFKIFDNSAKSFSQFLSEEISTSKSKEFEFNQMFGKYTMDVIASTAFGIDSKPYHENNKKTSIFEEMCERMQMKICFSTLIKAVFISTIPKIMKVLQLTLMDTKAYSFFEGVMLSVMQQRKTTGEKHNDFMQILLEVQNSQQIEKIDESEMDTFEKDAILNVDEEVAAKTVLDDQTLISQSMLFLLAGFDSTRSFLIFAAYQLALCPEIQDKLAKEVKSSWEKDDHEFTYDSIQNMEFLEKFTCEVLRMYPPAPRVDRRADKAYTIPGTDVVIEKDTLFYIPIYAIHHDEDNYPDPERFDPERFSPENKEKRNPYAYLPFGHGPRNCIAKRFALAESKMCLAHFVLNFVVEPCDKTLIPMRFGFEGTIKSAAGMWLTLKKRDWEEE